MSDLVIEVHPREETGKNANRRLRAAGDIPAVVYGGSKNTVPIRVQRKSILDLLKGSGSENAVFLLKLVGSGKERHTMIRELQVDPISREILHIDFQRVLMTEKIRVQVPVELAGVPEGVKNEGGMLDFVLREVEVECLPGDIPRTLSVDVSALHVGQHVEVKDLSLPPKVTLLEEADRVLASVSQARVAEVEAEEEEEGLLEMEPEQPEVIRRGKTEEEEAEEG